MAQLLGHSLACYATLHPDLQAVCDEALKILDLSILCGHRNEEAQLKAFLMKTSKLKWPDSRHNSVPSEAMDLAPVPLVWERTADFYYLAGVVMACAHKLGVKLTWGGKWKMQDLVHFELTR